MFDHVTYTRGPRLRREKLLLVGVEGEESPEQLRLKVKQLQEYVQELTEYYRELMVAFEQLKGRQGDTVVCVCLCVCVC